MPRGSGTPAPGGTSLRLVLVGLIFITGLYLLPTPARSQTVADSASDSQWRRVERHIFVAINGERQRRGLTPLIWDEGLARVARNYSRHLVEIDQLSHLDRRGQGPSQRIALGHRRLVGLVGENLAAFSGQWPEREDRLVEQMVRGWMKSPGHRRNILRRDYTHQGLGLAVDGSELRCTQLFASVHSWLATGLPDSLRQGSSWPLAVVDGFGEVPAGVTLQPWGSSRVSERFHAPSFVDPEVFRAEAAPGLYRLRFFYRRGGSRFTVVDGPSLEILPSSPP